jgi:hypothetical protein
LNTDNEQAFVAVTCGCRAFMQRGSSVVSVSSALLPQFSCPVSALGAFLCFPCAAPRCLDVTLADGPTSSEVNPSSG